MPYYEVLCLASGKLGRPELREVLRKTCRAFMDNGAVITRISPLGANGNGPRELAYPIRRNQVTHETGFYVNVCAFASPAALAEVNRQLSIDERVLRQLAVKRSFKHAVQPIPDIHQTPPPGSGVDPSDPDYALRKFVEEYEREFPDGRYYQGEEHIPRQSAARNEAQAYDGSVVDDVLASLKASTHSKQKNDQGLSWLNDMSKDETK